MKNTMTAKDIPLELIRNAERRRREKEITRLQKECIDAFFYLVAVVVFFWILKTFVR